MTIPEVGHSHTVGSSLLTRLGVERGTVLPSGLPLTLKAFLLWSCTSDTLTHPSPPTVGGEAVYTPDVSKNKGTVFQLTA